MPKAKPVSLHPLNFEEAIKALVGVDTGSGRSGSKRTRNAQGQRKSKPKALKKGRK